MTLGIAFWILWLVWFVFVSWSSWPVGGNVKPLGGSLVLFLLLALLGWKVFGPPIHG